MLALYIFLVWAVLGVVSELYWWTKEEDFTTEHLGFLLIGVICGPFTFIIGYFIVHRNEYPKTILKRRGKKNEALNPNNAEHLEKSNHSMYQGWRVL